MTERRDAIVIGGGVSGLAAGFHLAHAGLAVTLLEGSDRLGGVLETWREGEGVVELGPNTVAGRRAAAQPSGAGRTTWAERRPLAERIELAGLTSERLPASPAASRRYLWRRGALHPLPQS